MTLLPHPVSASGKEAAIAIRRRMGMRLRRLVTSTPKRVKGRRRVSAMKKRGCV